MVQLFEKGPQSRDWFFDVAQCLALGLPERSLAGQQKLVDPLVHVLQEAVQVKDDFRLQCSVLCLLSIGAQAVAALPALENVARTAAAAKGQGRRGMLASLRKCIQTLRAATERP